MTQAEHHGYDEDDAFLCACKGLPYTLEEWGREVDRLRAALSDALERLSKARAHGVCLPARFDRHRVEAAADTTITGPGGTSEDDRLVDELERAEEFLHNVGCGEGATAVHEAIRRLGPPATPAHTKSQRGSDSKGEQS